MPKLKKVVSNKMRILNAGAVCAYCKHATANPEVTVMPITNISILYIFKFQHKISLLNLLLEFLKTFHYFYLLSTVKDFHIFLIFILFLVCFYATGSEIYVSRRVVCWVFLFQLQA